MGIGTRLGNAWQALMGRDDVVRLERVRDGEAAPPGEEGSQIRADGYAPIYSSPADLDALAETDLMRSEYIRFYQQEPALRSAIEGSIERVASLDVQVIPADRSAEADKRVAQFCRDAVGNAPGGWPGLITSCLKPAYLCGWSVTEKVLKAVKPGVRWCDPLAHQWAGLWAPERLASKDTKSLRLQLDEARNVLSVVSTVRGLTGYSTDRVLIYTHNKLWENPFGMAEGRSVYRECQLIDAAMKLWGILLKTYTGPYLMAKSKQTGVQRRDLERALAAARGGGWLVCHPDDEIAVLDFATAPTFQAFEKKVGVCRQAIFTAICGTALPFMEGVQGGDNRGDTKVQKSASEAKDYLNAEYVCQLIRKELFHDLARLNFGQKCGVPLLKLGGVNWGETLKQLDVKAKLQSLGLPLSKQATYEQAQEEPPRDENDILPPPNAAPPAMPGGGLPFAQGNGGGPAPATFRDTTVTFAAPGPPPHPGLVWKEETHRWVLPASPETGTSQYKPQTKPSEDAAKSAQALIQEHHDNPSMKLVHEAFVGAATGDLDAAKIANAAAAMKSLNMHQLRALKTFYGVGGTTSNKDPMVANILAAVKGLPGEKAPASKPAAKEPAKAPEAKPATEKKPVTPQVPPPTTSGTKPDGLAPMPSEKPKYEIVATSIGGSTGAAKVKDADGNLYVRKDGSKGKGGVEQLKSEEACNAMYRAAGVTVPASAMYGDEKLGRWVEGKTLAQFSASSSPAQIQAVHAELQKGFAADCLFANYDVIGLSKDNVVVDKDGRPHRIDNGGSLTFRAQGGKKPFTAEVTEIAGLRNASLNPSAAAVYGSMTDTQVAESIKELAKKRAAILKEAPASLSATLSDRLDSMEKWADETLKVKPKDDAKSEKPHSDKGQSLDNFKVPTGFKKKDVPNKALPDAARPTLSKEEANSLNSYTGSDYHSINGGLRTPPPNSLAAKHIKVLKEAFDRAAVFEKPVTVYRGFSDKAGATDFLARVGDAITKNNGKLELIGFVSTSTRASGAFSGPAQIEIQAIHGIDAKPYSALSHEDELLLPHESSYEVVSYQHVGPKGVPYIKLKQLPPKTLKK